MASVTGGQVKDKRNLIPKIQSVAQKTSTLEEKLSTAEGQISQLVEAGTPSYLSKMLVVGGTYQEGDVLFEKDGKAYPTTIRLTRPDVHHTKPISTRTPLFELDIPEGKDFKMIIEEGWSHNEVYLTIGSAYSAGYADNEKY